MKDLINLYESDIRNKRWQKYFMCWATNSSWLWFQPEETKLRCFWLGMIK